jgi:glycine dehydrogenase
MVTNPNTSGLFEINFQKAAEMIHGVGGLVYMDGANMNAICAWADLGKMGVDAVHNNTHKTWSIPHGGGGPGDAFVAVSDKLIPYLPGIQVVNDKGIYKKVKAPKSIGSFHRHHGNFAHKVRAYTYLAALGKQGVRRISAMAVLSARYLQKKLETKFPMLPQGADASPRMHEFILTLPAETFKKVEAVGITHAQVISRMGKLFLDFGFHAPTVSFPEALGLMIEPTESYTKGELDRFAEAVLAMLDLVNEHPEVLLTVPHFTPIDRVDEVSANKSLVLSEKLSALPAIVYNRLSPQEIEKLSFSEIKKRILEAHQKAKKS